MASASGGHGDRLLARPWYGGMKQATEGISIEIPAQLKTLRGHVTISEFRPN